MDLSTVTLEHVPLLPGILQKLSLCTPKSPSVSVQLVPPPQPEPARQPHWSMHLPLAATHLLLSHLVVGEYGHRRVLTALRRSLRFLAQRQQAPPPFHSLEHALH
ncbi:hypothetical protein PC116_g9038 [Phytophthora cactorum]|uniref:Uncharacterized protein n=1 Tax=Phytophthora cactorum TaxID=29920 RepID=A0A8T1L794_9STRA|nr:hypothetical protein Pcac1_g24274 [Phytophthora cactorum]KAG2916416.1 hypothetical protein PC114_g7490 [Phytophthora cactorum]KAG2920001.1 hypothetical protein PC117_g16644 [Phytophthora cactorum]KAG3009341.1 hypothetical protein PC119_g13920 [Phytophthora cactorum]KAG3013711.1 hypothetical protein PC120_g13118 [Phytophthora cactorum]